MHRQELARYSRQLILPHFGAEGQLALKRARVLVIGGGGLGCPAVQYLASAGVGTLPTLTTGWITVMDADTVETSNLARQILHTDERVGMNKAASIAAAIKLLHPGVHIEAVACAFRADNALTYIQQHDVVLDCTDNVITRYLISDAGVLAGKPIVSGAAQGYEGQLIVLHRPLPHGQRGPCYRCLFPEAPRPEHTQSCDDGGVLGCVTGIVGTWQALETIKLLTGLGDPTPQLLFFTPMDMPAARCVRVRPRQIRTCRACGDADQVSHKIVHLPQENYVTFCGSQKAPIVVPSVPVSELKTTDALVVDVRPPHEFAITSLPGSLNMHWDTMRRDIPGSRALITSEARGRPIYVVCRRGNDSRAAVQQLDLPQCFNVTGGLRAFAQYDTSFPMY
ncbi:hypothetical protein MNAN1_001944 [Malassezia nana]|uniref:Rhodanese domain-containing protein n=1 Tax=Malassezia nana TaxID=180528 RepID=A0AAF0EJ98_9BASI|nr:hypothetical protein MNAN1_001944 [Malassezia nana]